MIYDIFDTKENAQKVVEPITLEEPMETVVQDLPNIETPPASKRDRLFSSFASRMFFLLLFIADTLWAVYAISVYVLSLTCCALTLNKIPFFRNVIASSWISVRRSIACGLSLFIALFSPAFGIMVACTYFLMYDKEGVEEIVPASLQEQFKEFFHP